MVMHCSLARVEDGTTGPEGRSGDAMSRLRSRAGRHQTLARVIESSRRAWDARTLRSYGGLRRRPLRRWITFAGVLHRVLCGDRSSSRRGLRDFVEQVRILYGLGYVVSPMGSPVGRSSLDRMDGLLGVHVSG